MWSVRIRHEASLHLVNSFITLTYDDDHVPVDGSLRYRDFQLFMKRLRKRLGYRFRFFVAGEYGAETLRPHYHAILFGVRLPDLKLWARRGGIPVYTSGLLSDVWRCGRAEVGTFSQSTAAYVAGYVHKKVGGHEAAVHYAGRSPEFCHMSQGIGRDWLRLYYQEVLAGGEIVLDGRKLPVPEYYKRSLDQTAGFERMQHEAAVRRKLRYADSTPERLRVRNEVAVAALKQRPRGL